MIYTTYFAKTRKIEDKDKLVSITRFPPKKANMKSFRKLAPSEELLRKYKSDGDKEYFINEFNKYLDTLNVDSIAKFLDGYVLCCYEKSTDFCHRHLVAEWFRKNGYNCEEFDEKMLDN